MKITIVSLTAATALIAGLGGSPAFAACVLPSGTTPGGCTYSGTGTALTIIDNNGVGNPITIEGEARGTNGRGVVGTATGKGGFGGLFEAVAPATSTTATTALEGLNSGGSTTAKGNYGNAGIFKISNAKNQASALSVTTNGINAYALIVTNTGTLDGTVTNPPSNNQGGLAAYFEVSNATNYSPTIMAVNSGGSSFNDRQNFGSAGEFLITNQNSPAASLFAQTVGNGPAVWGRSEGVSSGGFNDIGVEGDDESNTQTGSGIYGYSNTGFAGQFYHGKDGFQACTFAGGLNGWSCNAPHAMMDDLTAPRYADLLDKLDAMPVNYFRTKGVSDSVRYLGPSAEDFRAAFGLGRNDRSITEGNEAGVALAAAKGLYQKLKTDEAMIAAQGAEITELKRENAKLVALEARLAAQDAALVTVQATLAHLTGPGVREAKAE